MLLGPHFKYNGKSLIKLNYLQKKQIKQIEDKKYQYESSNCPCGSKNKDKLLSTRDKFGLYVRNVICENCGIIRINPRMNEKSYQDFYENHYRQLYTGKKEAIDIEKIFNAQYEVGKKYYSFINQSLRKNNLKNVQNYKSILEIGCSCGGILSYFKDKSHEIFGIDLDKKYIDFGKKKNLNLRHQKIADIKNIKFDLIILAHVFEHLLDLEESLKDIVKLLNNNGLLFINIPGIFNDSYYRHERCDFLYYVQNAHTYTFTENNCTKFILNKSPNLKLLNKNNISYILFQKRNLKKSSNKKKTFKIENEYEKIIKYINNVQKRKYTQLLIFYFKTFAIKVGIKKLIEKIKN